MDPVINQLEQIIDKRNHINGAGHKQSFSDEQTQEQSQDKNPRTSDGE